jgi:hypothetical protein
MPAPWVMTTYILAQYQMASGSVGSRRGADSQL